MAAESGTESVLQDQGSWSRTSGAPEPDSVPPARAAAGAGVRQYPARACVVAVPENPHRLPPGLTPIQGFECPNVAAASHSAPPPYRTARAVAAAPDASAWPPGAGVLGQASGRPGGWRCRLLHPYLSQVPGPRPGQQSPSSPAVALEAQSADGGADAG